MRLRDHVQVRESEWARWWQPVWGIHPIVRWWTYNYSQLQFGLRPPEPYYLDSAAKPESTHLGEAKWLACMLHSVPCPSKRSQAILMIDASQKPHRKAVDQHATLSPRAQSRPSNPLRDH
jgi:hypothetical protein